MNRIVSTRCRFDQNYDFELVNPAGNAVGADPVPASIELAYLTRTKRVTQPVPGRWTMRVTGGSPCVVEGSATPPEVAMFAAYRNHTVTGHVDLAKNSFAANEAVRVTAMLETGANTVATNIAVDAQLLNGSLQLPLTMTDDGTGADEVAGDGLYTGLINPSCSPSTLPPGGYRLVVDFESDSATAQSVLLPDVDVLAENGPLSVTPPISTSLTQETLIVVEGCNAAAPGCPGADTTVDLCPTTDVAVVGDVRVAPGSTTPGVTVEVSNCPIGSQGVTVGLGPGVTASNVMSAYDDAAGQGVVTFDLTAAPDAPPGEVPVRVFFGRTHCDSTGTVVDVCEELPSILDPAIHATCANGGSSSVTLSPPEVSAHCIPNAVVQGQVVQSNGAAVIPPLPIAADGSVSLPPGVHVIEWTVSGSGGLSQTVQQTVQVLPAFAADGRFELRDRSKVVTGSGAPVAIANLGAGLTQIGVAASSGSILSVADTFLQSHATVAGFLTTAGQLTTQSPFTVSGPISQNASLTLGNLSNPSVTFPSDMGSDIELEPGQTATIAAGTYRNVNVKSGATLSLSEGNYLIDQLSVEPQATVRVTPTTRLFVRSSFTYRGRFADAEGDLTNTFLAYYGQQSVVLEAPFNGRLFAESARVSFGAGTALTFTGQFFAKEIEVRPDVTLSCMQNGGSVFEVLSSTFNRTGPFAPPATVTSSSSGCSVSDTRRPADAAWAVLLIAAAAAMRRRFGANKRSR